MLLWTANVRNYFSLSALPSAAVQPFLIPAILFQASVLSPEKLGAEMYLANGDTSRRGTINLCQKHRSGQCGGATTRAVPRFVAGNCLSARETSRWNFRSPPFLRCRDFAWKFSEESRELTIFVCAIEENFDGWGIEDFFLRIARENYFSRGKRVEGGLKEFRYPCEIATTRRYLW